MRLVLGFLALTTACADRMVVTPIIDLPARDSPAFPRPDEIELSIAVEGDPDSLASETFQRGERLQLSDVPAGDAMVVHMLGRDGNSEVAAGRTCACAITTDQPPPSPHLYFAAITQFAEVAAPAVAPAAPVRIGGSAIMYEDGSALFIGGADAAGAVVRALDRFDPRRGAFVRVAELAPRTDAAVAALGNGRIVIAGGRDATTSAPAVYAEVVDVEAASGQRVSQVTIESLAVVGPAVVTLADGRIAAFGGRDATDAVTGRVVVLEAAGTGVAEDTDLPASTLATPRVGHTATRVSDDLGAPVLVTGGIDAADQPITTAELYLPLSGRFADPTDFHPAMIVPRYGHQAVRLPDGSVLFVGGLDALGAPVPRLERFVREAGFVDVGPPMPTGEPTPLLLPAGAGITAQSVTPLPDGRVLIAGGLDAAGVAVDMAFSVLLDPVNGVVRVLETDRLTVARAGNQAALMCDGTVMVVGGTSDPAHAAERYNPSSAGRR